MKTFKAFLSELSEKESDAEYNLRMKKTTRILKRSAKKGKRIKKRNKLRRRPDDKLNTAARAKAKKEVLPASVGKLKPSGRKKKVVIKKTLIDRKTKMIKRDLKKDEPKRIKAAKAAKQKK